MIITKSEAVALLLLLKSTTYEGNKLATEDGQRFQATLMNLGERMELHFGEDADKEQYDLWERIGSPAWQNYRVAKETKSESPDDIQKRNEEWDRQREQIARAAKETTDIRP